jgi:hypothetical protein
MYLDWNQESKFTEAVRETLKARLIMENFSLREIEEQFKDIISAAMQLPAPQRQVYIRSSVIQFFASFASQIAVNQVVVPISNLSIEKSFSVGDVEFKLFSKYQTRKWAGLFREVLKNNPHYNPAQKRDFVNSILEHNLKPLEGTVCTETTGIGKEEKASEIALRKVNVALDILKMYCMVERGQRDSNFGLKGEVLDSSVRSLLQRSISKKSLTPTLERVGPLFPLVIGNRELQMMRKYGLRLLNEILRKKNRTWVEKKILRAIYWYSRVFDTPLRRVDDEKIVIRRQMPSSKSEEVLEYGCINERLVKAFIALESLFIISDREAVQNSIAERVALVLANNYQDRKRIKKFLKDMYNFRSTVVHHGFTYVSVGELSQLVYWVRDSIITILLKKNRLKLNSMEDFYGYFEKQKLS